MRNYNAVRNQYLIRLGQEQLTKLEKYLNLETQTWDRIVLLVEAKRKRIRVGDEEVVDFIKQYPFFQSEGRFNPALYQEMLTYAFRSSPRVFEEEIRDNLILAKLYQEITQTITVTDDEMRDAYEKVNEQISLDYIGVQLQDFLDEVSIEEQELLDYYNKNSRAFSRPISYNLEYVELDYSNKQTISKITQLLNQGFNLQDIAKDRDLEVKETGFFSSNEPIPQIGWSTEILRILPKLSSEGTIWPKPIHTDTDIVYFVGLKEKKDPYIPSFDDVKNEVKQALRQQKAGQIAQDKINACRKEAEVLGLTKAVKKFNLKTGETELFKRRGYVKGLGDSDIFFEAVQNLKEGQISQILSTPSGFCVVKIKQRLRPDEKKFEQEKQDFAANLLEEKKQNYFTRFLTELKNKPNTFILSPLEKTF